MQATVICPHCSWRDSLQASLSAGLSSATPCRLFQKKKKWRKKWIPEDHPFAPRIPKAENSSRRGGNQRVEDPLTYSLSLPVHHRSLSKEARPPETAGGGEAPKVVHFNFAFPFLFSSRLWVAVSCVCRVSFFFARHTAAPFVQWVFLSIPQPALVFLFIFLCQTGSVLDKRDSLFYLLYCSRNDFVSCRFSNKNAISCFHTSPLNSRCSCVHVYSLCTGDALQSKLGLK